MLKKKHNYNHIQYILIILTSVVSHPVYGVTLEIEPPIIGKSQEKKKISQKTQTTVSPLCDAQHVSIQPRG